MLENKQTEIGEAVDFLRASCSYIDPKTIGRSGHIEVVEKRESDQSLISSDLRNIDLTQIQPADRTTWLKMPANTFSDMYLSNSETKLWRSQVKIKSVSSPRKLTSFTRFPEGSSVKEAFTICTAVIEDQNGMQMQTLPIFQREILESIYKVRSKRQVWDVIGLCIVVDSHFMYALMDALPNSELHSEPVYSNPDQYNVSLDILKHYSGQEIKIEEIKPEIESRFGTDLSYWKVRRAVVEIHEQKKKTPEGALYQIPSSENDRDAYKKLSEQFEAKTKAPNPNEPSK